MISCFPPEKEIKNFRHISIPIGEEYDTIIKGYMENSGDRMYMVKTLPKLSKIAMKLIDTTLYNSEVQNLMSEDNFDLVVVEGIMGDTYLGLGAHFKCPTIIFSSLSANPLVDIVGNPLSVESVPNVMLGYREPMNFKQRIFNFLSAGIEKIIGYFIKKTHLEYYTYVKI